MDDISELRKAIYALEEQIARLEEQFKATTAATEKQAVEYARRLGELNHAHEQAKETLATYVPREVYERKADENALWRSIVDKELATNRGRSSMIVSVIAAFGAFAAFVGTVLNYLQQMFKSH